jgi:hypothetical protein
MDQELKVKMMKGVDLDEEEEKNKRTAQELDAIREYKEIIKDETKAILDFSYYHLGNIGLKAILPQIETEYILNIKELDLSYNSLNDAGLQPLVQSLSAFGSPIETLNLSGNNVSD